MDGAVQHDAHELNRLLIEALERSLKHTKGDVLCQLYKGLLVNQTRCTGCDFVSDRPEHYYDLNVQVNNFDDLVGSLRQYCAAEVLEGDSAYLCDRCQGRRRTWRPAAMPQRRRRRQRSSTDRRCERRPRSLTVGSTTDRGVRATPGERNLSVPVVSVRDSREVCGERAEQKQRKRKPIWVTPI